MARPPNLRRIGIGCETRVFKPVGSPLHALGVVRLDLDGLEALRLADLDGLYQEAAAEQMGVSRATFGRILTEARARVAQALVEGKALRIGGGSVVGGEAEALPCPLHWGGPRRGRGCRCRGRWASDTHGTVGVESAGDPPAGGTHEREER